MDEQRWPPGASELFAVVSSVALWALMILVLFTTVAGKTGHLRGASEDPTAGLLHWVRILARCALGHKQVQRHTEQYPYLAGTTQPGGYRSTNGSD